jgi:hypothetical protein
MVLGDLSLACDVEQRGFRRCRLLRGKTQVGATSPSMHAATARAYFAQYHRVPLLLREKKNVHLAPILLGETRGVLTVRGGPRGKSQRLL